MSLASTSLASASALVLLQLFSRGFTFVLNQALVRIASPEVFGTAAIQFELLLATILFLSREGVRNALLRSPVAGESSSRSANNIAILPILAGGPVALIASLVYFTYSTEASRSQPYFAQSVAVYGIAAFLELLSEPFYIHVQNALRIDVRVRAEGAAIVVKNLTTFVILVGASPDFALLAFAVGQLMYAASMLAVYLWDAAGLAWDRLRLKSSKDNQTEALFEPALLNLSVAHTKQSLVKHILTEGDKFMVSRISPLQDQGGYALASNYGSLIARIVFQPIEETSRVFFSKTLAPVLTQKDDKDNSEEEKKAISTAKGALSTILLLQIHLALLVFAFGPPYLDTLLRYALPKRYLATSAPAILRVYIAYIPMMALNGILEAFLASAASSEDLSRQSSWMTAFSVIYASAGYFFAVQMKWGDAGIVWANVVNSAARAIYGWIFAKNWFKTHSSSISLTDCLPSIPAILAIGLSGVVAKYSERKTELGSLQHDAIHVGIGGVMGVLCLAICILSQRHILTRVSAFAPSKPKTE